MGTRGSEPRGLRAEGTDVVLSVGDWRPSSEGSGGAEFSTKGRKELSDSPLGSEAARSKQDDEGGSEELKRDFMYIVLLLFISGAIVSLNLMGLLVGIPGLRRLVTSKLFTIEEIQALAKTLSLYAKEHFLRTLTAQIMLGTWVQTFMIPGATVLNMLAGNNFGLWTGLATSMFYNSLGSVLLYLISRSVGRRIAKRYFSDRIERIQSVFRKRKGEGSAVVDPVKLIIYLTSLRMLPFTPNWLLNVSLASLEIPLNVFIPSTMLGLLPYNYLAVSAGLILQDLTSVTVMNTSASVQLAALAVAGFLVPSLLDRCRARGSIATEPAAPTTTIDYYWKQVRKAHQSDER